MERQEVERIVERARPVTFAVFGHLENEQGERIVRVGGSGVFIAPYYAATARHVARGLIQELDWRGQNQELRPGYFRTAIR